MDGFRPEHASNFRPYDRSSSRRHQSAPEPSLNPDRLLTQAPLPPQQIHSQAHQQPYRLPGPHEWTRAPPTPGSYSGPPPPPPDYMNHSHALPSPRRRTAISCKYCRRRKIRCSGFDDTADGRCTNCARFNQDCIFTPVSAQTQAFVPAHTVWRGVGQSPPMYGAYGQPLSPIALERPRDASASAWYQHDMNKISSSLYQWQEPKISPGDMSLPNSTASEAPTQTHVHQSGHQLPLYNGSFATRRSHAAQLGNFELPPPPMHKHSSFNTIDGSQSSQAPMTIASVGNLLTPPNKTPDDVISLSKSENRILRFPEPNRPPNPETLLPTMAGLEIKVPKTGSEKTQASMGSAYTGSVSTEPSDDHTEGSDQSSDNDARLLTKRKEEIVDRLMVQFYDMFDTTGTPHYRNHGSGAPSKQSHTAKSTAQTNSSGGDKKRCTSEQTNQKGDKQDDDNEQERSGKRPRRSNEMLNSSAEDKKKLACPYYKHNPRKYRNFRSCPGPGWETIHRLKEHLYRRHALPPQCPRCCSCFTNEAQLKEHLRAAESCKRQEQEEQAEGLERSQIEKLKGRQSMFRAGSEEEKWKIVYLIVFPETPLSELPSPYYDYEPVPDSPSNECPVSKCSKRHELEQYEAYMSRELPRKVRKELESAIEKIIGPVEETLKNQMETIVRNCQESLSKIYELNQVSLQKDPEMVATTPPTTASRDILTIDNNFSDKAVPEARVFDTLAQFTEQPWNPIGLWDDTGTSSAAWNQTSSSDPMYRSETYNPPIAGRSDSWWSTFPTEHEPLEYTGMMTDLDTQPNPMFETNLLYTDKGKGKGKGKGAANAGTSRIFTDDVGMLNSS